MKKNKQLRVGFLVIIALCLIINGCAPNNNNAQISVKESQTPSPTQATKTSVPTMPSHENINVTPTTIAPIATSSLTEYEFEAILDYSARRLSVSEKIRYTNQSGSSITEIHLSVPPNRFPNVFTMDSLILNDSERDFEVELNGIDLLLTLFDPLASGDILDIEIVYLLQLHQGGAILGYSERQINFSDWYPYIPPYNIENGWSLHQPAEVGEYLVYDRANFHLRLTIIGQDNFAIAGSSTVIPMLDGCEISVLNARNLTFSVSDQYIVLNKKFGDITVTGYVFPENESAGWEAVEHTGNALLYFSEKFNALYPHESITLVEADFSDGMEYDGLYYLSRDFFKDYDDPVKNYRTLLAVHETAHQWWYGIVANDQALEPWLDEALATYSEYLYIENFYPELLDWWWEYRVFTYNPAGSVGMTIYDKSDLRGYINAVYLRGALYIHSIRQALGDDAFFTALQNYSKTCSERLSDSKCFSKSFFIDSNDLQNSLNAEYFSD